MPTKPATSNIGHLPGTAARRASVKAFLMEHGSALASAALLLGGTAAEGRVLDLLTSVRSGRVSLHQTLAELQRVLRLLALQDVGDPDRLKTLLAAEIDPSSELVVELCLLHDALANLLRNVWSDGTEAVPASALEWAA